MQEAPKAVWSILYVSLAFFPSLKQNVIAYRSSKVSSRPDYIFEIHQLWQSGFSRVHSNSYCSRSFETEIIKIGQSSRKMNFQESTAIVNAHTKKSLETYHMPLYLSKIMPWYSISLCRPLFRFHIVSMFYWISPPFCLCSSFLTKLIFNRTSINYSNRCKVSLLFTNYYTSDW